jgi:hypothetical protein
MFVSQVGSNCAWADAVAKPGKLANSTLTAIDMVDLLSIISQAGRVQRSSTFRPGTKTLTSSPDLDLDQAKKTGAP